MPKKAAFHPGIQMHDHPMFENRSANVANLPDLPLRFAFVASSGSGKGVCMLDLLLRHYRGAFDRIYFYSRSASLDTGWDSVRKYVEEDQHVNQDEEPTFLTSLMTRRSKSRWIFRCAWRLTQRRQSTRRFRSACGSSTISR